MWRAEALLQVQYRSAMTPASWMNLLIAQSPFDIDIVPLTRQKDSLTYKVRDAFSNDCMRITVHHERKGTPYIHLHSLNYESNEQQCTLSPIAMVEWLKSLIPAIIGSLHLTDTSHITLEGDTKRLRMPLRLVRKFFRGQSYYEKLGFAPRILDEGVQYNASFHAMRQTSFDAVCIFIGQFLKPFTRSNGSFQLHVIPDFETYYVLLNHILPHSQSKLREYIELLGYRPSPAAVLKKLAQILLVFSYPSRSHVPDMQKDEHVPFEGVKLRKPSPRSLLEVWSPYFQRFSKVSKKTQDDSVSFFEMVTTVLQLFEQIGLLFVPSEMVFPPPKYGLLN